MGCMFAFFSSGFAKLPWFCVFRIPIRSTMACDVRSGGQSDYLGHAYGCGEHAHARLDWVSRAAQVLEGALVSAGPRPGENTPRERHFSVVVFILFILQFSAQQGEDATAEKQRAERLSLGFAFFCLCYLNLLC